MYRVSDQEVDFILSDLAQKGVVTEDLRYNLLDHLCCIIENEMSEEHDFNAFYESILPRFFKKELKELQEETDNLIRFKNYYAMKKTLYITGVVSALLTIAGSVLKTFHLPGVGMAIVLGGVVFSLIFLPLIIALKFKDDESTTDKLVFGFGFLLGIAASMGVIFKLMHWPGANVLMLSSVSLFTFGYVPLYFITRIRRPDLKFNTVVNSVLMMACGGLLFAMFNLGHSQYVRNSFYVMHENIRHEVLASNDEVDQMYSAMSDSLKQETKEVYEATKELVGYIDQIRVKSIMETQNASAAESESMNIVSMNWGLAATQLQHDLMNPNSDLNAVKLKEKIENWKALLSNRGIGEERIKHWLRLEGFEVSEENGESWEETQFGFGTVVSVITYMDQLTVELNMRTIQYLESVQ